MAWMQHTGNSPLEKQWHMQKTKYKIQMHTKLLGHNTKKWLSMELQTRAIVVRTDSGKYFLHMHTLNLSLRKILFHRWILSLWEHKLLDSESSLWEHRLLTDPKRGSRGSNRKSCFYPWTMICQCPGGPDFWLLCSISTCWIDWSRFIDLLPMDMAWKTHKTEILCTKKNPGVCRSSEVRPDTGTPP